MISIENFYYILYRHLLKPLNLQDTMFAKFGSTNPVDIHRARYSNNLNMYGKIHFCVDSCYYFDQEPVQSMPVGDLMEWTTTKHFKMLANSEVSKLKKQLCREYQCQDWYYFFHGFAALDWYRDGQCFDQHIDWTRAYITLNRLHVNDRSYRLNLVARLAQQNLLDRGHVSLHLGHTEYGTWQQELRNPNTRLSSEACELIATHLDWPLILDRDNTTGSLSADFGHQEFELWKSGLSATAPQLGPPEASSSPQTQSPLTKKPLTSIPGTHGSTIQSSTTEPWKPTLNQPASLSF
jgi:hypothetical protein